MGQPAFTSSRGSERVCGALRVRTARAAGIGIVVGAVAVLVMSACTRDTLQDRYLWAEQLQAQGEAAAAVAEFDRVAQKDPQGRLGAVALYRAAMLETLYLAKHAEALKRLKQFVALPSARAEPETWAEAEREIGEILFERLEQYDAAAKHYGELITAAQAPSGSVFAPDQPRFRFRRARALFFLWRFDEAESEYQQLIERYGASPEAEEAKFQLAEVWYARGERVSEVELKRARVVAKKGETPAQAAFGKSLELYEGFLAAHPKSKRAAEAEFGAAASLEEQGRLQEALERFERLGGRYPSPNVVKIRVYRLKERIAQSTRSAVGQRFAGPGRSSATDTKPGGAR